MKQEQSHNIPLAEPETWIAHLAALFGGSATDDGSSDSITPSQNVTYRSFDSALISGRK